MYHSFCKLFVPAIFIVFTACNSADTNQTAETAETPPIRSCKLQLLNIPDSIVAGKPLTLNFKALAEPHDTIPELDSANGKRIDFVITSNDLSWFTHLYAAKDSAGVYSVQTQLPSGGDFLIMAAYTATGLKMQTDSIHLAARGARKPPVEYKAPVLISNTDGYTVQLLSKELRAYIQTQVIIKIMKDGNPVFPEKLQPLLGEQTHMVCINTATHAYVHVTSKNDPMSYWYLMNFPGGGLYKTWIEFKHNDKVHTAEFVISVKN